jgi:hypothetical protein
MRYGDAGIERLKVSGPKRRNGVGDGLQVVDQRHRPEAERLAQFVRVNFPGQVCDRRMPIVYGSSDIKTGGLHRYVDMREEIVTHGLQAGTIRACIAGGQYWLEHALL